VISSSRIVLNCNKNIQRYIEVKGLKKSGHLYTATYREARTAAVYNAGPSNVLTSTSSRQRSAICGSPLPKRTDFGSLEFWTPQSAAITDPPMPKLASQPHYGLHPVMFSSNDSLVLVASITRY